jgi:hypothetical protein
VSSDYPHSDGAFPEAIEQFLSLALSLLLVGMTPGPEVETAFNAWYDTKHIPALARVPGVLSARRFRTICR